MYKNSAEFTHLGSAAYTAITSSYTQVGSSFANPVTVFGAINTTDATIYLSTDGVTDMVALPTGFGRVWDVKTNSPAPANQDYVFPSGTPIYIKYVGSAPTKNSFYFDALQAVPI